MPERLIVSPEEIRVLFTAREAESFLRGSASLPEGGGDDVLQRVVRRVLKRLALDFAGEAEEIEVRAEPVRREAPADGWVTWYVVRFRLAGRRGSTDDVRALEHWVDAHAPRLSFGVRAAGATARFPAP